MTRALATLLVWAYIVTLATGALQDGLPRPANLVDEPNTSYGPEPVLSGDSGASVPPTATACDWFGFSNTLYSNAITSSCQATLRKAILNTTDNPVSTLKKYKYYTLRRLIDPATNESYCYQGCFKLNFATPPVPEPPSYILRGPALSPMYFGGPAMAPGMEPVMAPMYYDGPAMAPVGKPPCESPYWAPAMTPGN